MWHSPISPSRPLRVGTLRVRGGPGDEVGLVAALEDWIRRYLPLAEIATVTQTTADVYADIRLELKRLGTPIPHNDVWIVAFARQHVLPVLRNDSHFDVVEGVECITFAPAD